VARQGLRGGEARVHRYFYSGIGQLLEYPTGRRVRVGVRRGPRSDLNKDHAGTHGRDEPASG
jgi:hypothetical protein